MTSLFAASYIPSLRAVTCTWQVLLNICSTEIKYVDRI